MGDQVVYGNEDGDLVRLLWRGMEEKRLLWRRMER
jgi:hypothetical protein